MTLRKRARGDIGDGADATGGPATSPVPGPALGQPDGLTTDISSLQALLEQQQAGSLPPVERWDPPYCGDIGMKIARDGTWFYQGSPIGRKPLVRLFARVLRKDADDKHYLVTPVEKVDVAVEDAPFLAVEMDVSGSAAEQTLVFRTNVDDIVRLDHSHPMRFAVDPGGGGLKPYITVRGRLEALVNRAVYYDLIALAQPNEQDRLGFWSGGVFWPVEAPARDA